MLESEQLVPALGAHITPPAGRAETDQLGLFGAPSLDPLVERLREVDVNALTPLQALALLGELAESARADAQETTTSTVAPPASRA